MSHEWLVRLLHYAFILAAVERPLNPEHSMKRSAVVWFTGMLVVVSAVGIASGDEGVDSPSLAPEVLVSFGRGTSEQTKIAVTALIEVLRKEAKSSDATLFKKAGEALVKIGVRAALAVTKLLDEKEEAAVRREAARILGDIGPKAFLGGAVVPLRERLKKDKDDVVRKNAAEALGKIGTAAAAQDLVDALQDKDPEVRLAAAEALGKIFAEGDSSK